MEPFRPVRGGGVRAWLAAAEASLLRSLVGQVMTLIAPERPEDAAGAGDAPGPRPGGAADPDDLAGLEALLRDPGPAGPRPPADPVLARLLPDGYRDDPEAAGEFRRYTEHGLRSAKWQAARQMLDTLPDAGGRVMLDSDAAQAWLKALNDVRLALGVRLGVTEEFEEQWGRLRADDPLWAAFEVYAWLGAVQESLVRALSLPGTRTSRPPWCHAGGRLCLSRACSRARPRSPRSRRAAGRRRAVFAAGAAGLAAGAAGLAAASAGSPQGFRLAAAPASP
jgi:hypothetical protein